MKGGKNGKIKEKMKERKKGRDSDPDQRRR